jgi:hypothetical protein
MQSLFRLILSRMSTRNVPHPSLPCPERPYWRSHAEDNCQDIRSAKDCEKYGDFACQNSLDG